MKKLLIISISIMIILALSISVMAKAVQLDLTAVGVGEEGWGKVILNNPAGTLNLVVQVDLKGAMPNSTYDVWILADNEDLSPLIKSDTAGSNWYNLGELETNVAGNGTLHCNVALEYAGTLEVIKVYLNSRPKANAYISEGGPLVIE